MVPASHVLAFAAVATVLIAIPGPSVLFTVSRALTVGRRSALLTVAGNELGGLTQVVAVAFGVGALVQRSAEAFTVVKWAGAAYLACLGVQAIRHRQSMAEALAARVPLVRPLRAVRDGFVIGVTNPKSIVFFVVALPEFTDRAAGHLPVQAQMLIIGALFPAIALVLDSAWAAVAGTARQWFTRSPRRLALIGGTGGLVMIGLGVSIAVTGRKDLSGQDRDAARAASYAGYRYAGHPADRSGSVAGDTANITASSWTSPGISGQAERISHIHLERRWAFIGMTGNTRQDQPLCPGSPIAHQVVT
jgi:threonine/homoserine/homoserine lactone efflux protein